MAKVDGRIHNDPTHARTVLMHDAAYRAAQDPKRLAKALRVVRAGIKLGFVTARTLRRCREMSRPPNLVGSPTAEVVT
jgi:hypothetical protein